MFRRMERSNKENAEGNVNEEVDWELRPGGMLVQKREDGVNVLGPMIKIKVVRGSYKHEISVPSQSTFGNLKRVLAHETGLEPNEQRLLFRGKEKDDNEYLHMVGVKDMSKLLLLENPVSKELEETKETKETKEIQENSKAYEAVTMVRLEVNDLGEKVLALEVVVRGGTQIAEKDFAVLTELLMVQLLRLDSIEAEGEVKLQRRIEVKRVQSLMNTIDELKAINSNPSSGSSNSATVTTHWEKFEGGTGSLRAPIPTKFTQNSESFDE